MRLFFEAIYQKAPKEYKDRFISTGEEKDTLHIAYSGWVFGILERTLIFTLFLLNEVSALALIIAAKSLARSFHQNEKGFGEHFFIGTLMSVLIALVGGILARMAG